MEEQKLCLKAQGFKEDIKPHNVYVINAVDNKLDAYKTGRYDGYMTGYNEGFKDGIECGYNKAMEEIKGKHNVDWKKMKKITKETK